MLQGCILSYKKMHPCQKIRNFALKNYFTLDIYMVKITKEAAMLYHSQGNPGKIEVYRRRESHRADLRRH